MRKFFLILMIMAFALIFLSACSSQQGSPQAPADNGGADNTGNTGSVPEGTPSSYSIDISGFAFRPAELAINKGDTVTWTNNDSAPHDVTSLSGETELASKTLQKGETYTHTFNSLGAFDYYCSIHPSMVAKIIVN